MQKPKLLPDELADVLRKQKYHLIGRHSAVKRCRWFYESLIHNRSCYKHKFFGIKSWRCVQMTPTVAYCNLRCLFCWRVQPSDIGLDFNETQMTDWDDPETIADGCLKSQLSILSGYRSHPTLNMERYEEAFEPKHAAISLDGEPTLYPELDGLVKEFHKRGLTTFIVTNGTIPEVLTNLSEEPTQLYVSLTAPDEEAFLKVCRPLVPNAWQKLNQTLEALPSFSCPTVVRLTSVRNLNIRDPEKYAKLIEKANPTYVEPKGYVYVGMSRKRLKYENMPTHNDIRQFAQQLSELTGYKIIDESPDSLVVLLSRLNKPIKLV